ncbi:MAG: beta-N-acetylglucosaminidase domain-containing protein [Polyangiaceae bacterium]
MARVGHGVIEGFYGRPWTTAERVSFVERIGGAGLETFIVAPKNDPAGFSRPRRAARDFSAIAEVARAAARARVRLYVSTCLENAPALLDAGAHGVVVSMDDTWTTFAPGLATESRGRAHGSRAAEALARIGATASTPVLLVPAIYHRRAEDLGRGALAYLRGIAAVAADVPVAWTGPSIFSRWVTAGDAARWKEATGLSIWLWNNAVTNDWLPLATGELVGARAWQKLCFGSVDNMVPGVERELEGVLLNAAREPAVSHVSALCLAAWLRDPLHYDARREVASAIREVGAHHADLLALAHDLTCRHPLSAPSRFEAAELADAVSDYVGGRSGADAVIARLEALVRAAERARSSDDALVREILPTLEKAAALGAAAALGVERREGAADKRADRLRAAAMEPHLRRARSLRWQVGLDSLHALLSRPGTRR